MSVVSLALLLFAVGTAATGQVLLKHGMRLATERAEATHRSLVMTTAMTPWVIVGLTVFAVSAVAWLATLSKLPLSIAYPFNSLGYLGILGMSVFILHERASAGTWIGSVLVVCGLVIVVLTRP